MVKKVTALIPCWNEEKTIGAVLDFMTNSNFIDEVVVVNDGSTDRSLEIIKKHKGVKVINLNKNSGKGNAISKGLEVVTNSLVFLCDADVIGLTDSELVKIVDPVRSGKYRIAVGMYDWGGRIYAWIRRNLMVLMSGNCVLYKSDLEKITKSKYAEGWGIEPYRNYYFRKKGWPMLKLTLKGTTDVRKANKQGFGVWITRIPTYWKVYGRVFLLNFLPKEVV